MNPFDMNEKIVSVNERTLYCPNCGSCLTNQGRIVPHIVDADNKVRDISFLGPRTRSMSCESCGVVVIVPLSTLRGIELHGRGVINEWGRER